MGVDDHQTVVKLLYCVQLGSIEDVSTVALKFEAIFTPVVRRIVVVISSCVHVLSYFFLVTFLCSLPYACDAYFDMMIPSFKA